MVRDQEGNGQGFAFIEFMNSFVAGHAMSKLDGRLAGTGETFDGPPQ
jgi:hypothetical protein